MKDHPKVTVIVPTFNRCQGIMSLVACLRKQTFPASRFEVVIMDDGSTDDTLSQLAAISRQVPFVLRVMTCERLGPGEARNSALRVASGELVLFTDSDCEPSRTWISEMVAQATDPRAVLCGRVDVPTEAGPLPRAVNCLLSSWLGGLGFSWRVWGFIPGYRLRTLNAAVPRRSLAAVGGFRCSGGSYGEDTELGERLEGCGLVLKHHSAAVVSHRENRSLRDYALEAMAKGLAAANMIRQGAIKPRGIYSLPVMLIFLLAVLIPVAMLAPNLVHLPASLIVSYLFLLTTYGIVIATRTGNLMTGLIFPVVTFLLHISYGMGILLALSGASPWKKGSQGPSILAPRRKEAGITYIWPSVVKEKTTPIDRKPKINE